MSHDEQSQKGNSDAGLDGIAGALARALQERSKAIHSSGMLIVETNNRKPLGVDSRDSQRYVITI